MAVHFEESKTKENLMRAFAGESQARNRYTIAAERARRAGMDTIAEMFLYTADQERAHAERFYELLKEESGKTIFIDGGYPVDQQENLADLLKAAEHNEKEEFEEIYPAFAEIAKQEGFFEAASAFLQIAEIEHVHQKRFGKVAKMLQTAQTADISMRENRRRKYVRSAVMSREIFFHMNLLHTVWIPSRIQDKEWSKCTKNNEDLKID